MKADEGRCEVLDMAEMKKMKMELREFVRERENESEVREVSSES